MAERGRAALEKDLVVDDAGDLFDNIDDLLDFPDDADAGGGVLGGWGRGSALLCSGALLPEESGSGFSGPDSDAADDLGAGLSVPTEDIPELGWLSSFVEDSFPAGSFGLEAAVEDRRGCHKDGRIRTSSPVSVLDSTSSTSSNSSRKLAAPPLVPHNVVPSRARSKLPRRPATFRFCKPLSLVSPTSSTDETDPHSSLRAHFLNYSNFSLEFDSNVELRQRKKIAKKTKKKQKLFVAAAASSEVAQPVRKCTHCEIQKTPQWRAGPMGPKTLCNACGVRYKSGRLFPEYRPAASPTFVPALHSNSHKKVLEMRDEMGQKDPAPVPQFVRKTSHWDGSANGGHQEIFVN